MKQNDIMKRLATVGALLVIGSWLTGCGTISSGITGGKRPVFLIHAPSDIQVYHEGERKTITREAFALDAGYYSTTTYFTLGVKMPFKKKTQLELYSPSQQRKANVELKPKRQFVFYLATLFVMPIGGWILDAATGNDKTLYPRFVDVDAALTNSSWQTQGKLKRESKRNARAHVMY